jgi:hypothetical protein
VFYTTRIQIFEPIIFSIEKPDKVNFTKLSGTFLGNLIQLNEFDESD